MPNHITNVMRITAYKHRGAPEGLIDEMLEALKGTEAPIDFNRVIPMPAGLDAPGQDGWYGWSIENWGTKWNAYCGITGKVDDRTAYLHFETAWAPPIPVISALAAKFPLASIRLIWCDEGDDKQHRVYWDEGTLEDER